MRNSVPFTASSLVCLSLAQLLVMLPFMLYLPLWLLPLLVFSAVWRFRALKGYAIQPHTVIKAALITAGVGGLFISGLSFPTLDAMVALLLMAFAFKTLETVRQRDAMVVILLGYVLVAIHFLYNQSIMAALYGCSSMILLTAALIAIQQPRHQTALFEQIRFNVRLSSAMLLQCLPLMLFLFLCAPRLPPLWAFPDFSGQSKTGVSDQMTPGDIASLSQSDELAFRVSFENEVRPLQNQLYWRGLTLNHFNGKRWRQFAYDYEHKLLKQRLNQQLPWAADRLELKGEPLVYEAIYERSGQPWLFTLAPSVYIEGEAVRFADDRVMAKHNLHNPLLLKATSYPEAVRERYLSDRVRRLTLQLPMRGNQRSREFAQQLFAQVNNPATYVKTILQRFREQNYYYTLRPPLLGDIDTIDRFLFTSKRGFCEHYASSFVFLMRAAGIPARVVVGYQGGEWNPNSEYLLVRQFDAHAWAEVWLEDRGWIRVDPTAAVAPSRIEENLEAAVREEGSFLENQLFLTRDIAWLRQLGFSADALQYQWQRWVLGYDGTAQFNFFELLFGESGLLQRVLLIAAVIASILFLWVLALGLFQGKKKLAVEQRLYQSFCQHFAKLGFQREPSQTPAQFAKILQEQVPQQAEMIAVFDQCYQEVCYVPLGEGERGRLLKQMRVLLRRLGQS